MKVMILGDTHGDTTWTRDIIRKAKILGVERIIQCGDFGIWDHSRDGVIFLDTVNEELRDAGIGLHFVDGNHENHDHLRWYGENLPRNGYDHVLIRSHIMHIPRGNRWNMEGKTFMGVGGAFSIDKAYRVPGKSWWDGEQLSQTEADKIAYEASRDRPVDFLITHDCATSTPFKQRIKDDLDSHAHRQRMDKIARAARPRLWFHGHMHEKYDWMFPLNTDRTNWTQVYGMEMNRDHFSWGILDTVDASFTWGPHYNK